MIRINLENKTALVTGASRGLGAAIAQRLGAAGAAVVVNYRERRDAAEQLARKIGGATIWPADVSDRAEVDRMIGYVAGRFGGIDILVNNAGVMLDRTLAKLPPTHWQRVIEVNLTGTFQVTQLALPHLNCGGRIVNLASIAGVMGYFGQTSYAAAKAGVITMTKLWSKELAKRDILVNAVAPGIVLTDMASSIPDAQLERIREAIPLGRFGEPEEIADVVLFLCSDLARYVTGQTIHVNGGSWA